MNRTVLPPECPTLENVTAALTAEGAPFEIGEAVIGGTTQRVWKHQPENLTRVFETAQLFGDREFLIYESERVSYDGFVRATLTLAEFLKGRGVTPGDRVAIILANRPEWPVAFFATQLLGALAVPIGANLAAPEIAAVLEDVGASTAINDGATLGGLTHCLPGLPALKTVIASRAKDGGLPSMAMRLEAILGPAANWASLQRPDLPLVFPESDADAAFFLTSGTTGRPRAVIVTHRNILSILRVAAFSQARVALISGRAWHDPEPLEAKPNSTLAIAPFSHVTSCCAGLVPTVMRGGKLVFMRQWDPESAMALIETERINATGGAPTIARQLADHPSREKYDLSSVRFIQFGGAPAGSDLAGKVTDAFKGAMPIQGYGLTETCATFCNHSGPDYAAHPEACGLAPPVGQIRIMDPDGTQELPVGEVGEIWLKGPQVARGYWNRPQETADTFVEGWLRTGDIGRLDAERRLYILDRAKDVIIRGGENIYCSEVEQALESHPAIAEAAVLSRPHPLLGEEPVALVSLAPGQTADERALRIHVRKRLALFKTPVSVTITRLPLPRNSAGKLDKAACRSLMGTVRG